MKDLVFTLPVEAFEQLVEQVAERVLERVADLGAGDTREWLSVQSAAEYLDCTQERVRKLIARRQIPYYSEGVGCRITLRRADLDEWLSGLRHEPRGAA